MKKDQLIVGPFNYAIFFSSEGFVTAISDFLEKTNFNKTGVITVVTTTIIMIGPKNADAINPNADPLLATIKATSPLETIPVPIWMASLFV